MANIGYAVQRMRYWCDVADLGYGQDTRAQIFDGGAADCSSLVIHVLKEAGFNTNGAYFTGDMVPKLMAAGWSSVPVSQSRAGDVLVTPNDHTALVMEDGEHVGEAYINEFGRITGGRNGDQTGMETTTKHYKWYRSWAYCLRAPAGSGTVTPGSGSGGMSEEEELMSAADMIINELVKTWLKPMWNKLDVMDKYCNKMFYEWVQPIWHKNVQINATVQELAKELEQVKKYDGPLMGHVKYYMTALLVKGYTVDDKWFPGLHQVAAENQKRIDSLAAGLEQANRLLADLQKNPPRIDMPGTPEGEM